MIPIARPLIGDEEKAAVRRVLDSGQLAQGEVVAELERRFAAFVGARHAVAVSSGTAALHVALLAHGVGAGDEVVTSPFSFVASANAILHAGARPVFADVEPGTLTLDPARLEAAIGPRTRAVVPVHLYGHPAPMPEIHAVARRHGLAVVEDACQAHGAAIDGRPVGASGIACFSFYPTKNMTTGEGGLVATDDDALAERMRMLRSHGSRRRYHHEVLGYNYRLTDLHAAVGLAQLDRLAEWNDRRRANAAALTATLRGVATPIERPGYRHVYHQYTVRVPTERDAVAARLAAAGIGTAVHYPTPIHRQPYYQTLGYGEQSFPVAERAAREVLSLPVHPGLSSADLETIAAAVARAVAQEAAVP